MVVHETRPKDILLFKFKLAQKKNQCTTIDITLSILGGYIFSTCNITSTRKEKFAELFRFVWIVI